MTRLKRGEVVEISTPVGRLYPQAINYHREYGTLVRVPETLFDAAPAELDGPSFPIFSPLGDALQYEYPEVRLRSVGQMPVPEEWQSFPTFRQEIFDDEGEAMGWALWDGNESWSADELSPAKLAEYPRLLMGPIYGLVYYALEAAGQPVGHASLERWFGVVRAERPPVTHYLLLPTLKAATAAAKRLSQRGEVETIEDDDESQWLVLVHAELDAFPDEQELEFLARDLGGVYDGSEVAVEGGEDDTAE